MNLTTWDEKLSFFRLKKDLRNAIKLGTRWWVPSSIKDHPKVIESTKVLTWMLERLEEKDTDPVWDYILKHPEYQQDMDEVTIGCWKDLGYDVSQLKTELK